jgi:1,4-dihydroxy-2-naphthoyl-CoA hydrolase
LTDTAIASRRGLEFTALGEEYLEARMPVDERTMQPMGLLHGGASAALAETVGGAGAYLCVDEGTVCVGLEINANHIRPAQRGWVYARATCLHRGKTTQVWQIMIRDEQQRLVCVSRLTVAAWVKESGRLRRRITAGVCPARTPFHSRANRTNHRQPGKKPWGPPGPAMTAGATLFPGRRPF